MVDYGSHILLANVLFHGTMSHLRTRGPANLGSLLVLILLQQLGGGLVSYPAHIYWDGAWEQDGYML